MTTFVLLASTLLLAAFFVFVYKQKRQPYLFAWSVAWLLLSVDFASVFLESVPSKQPWQGALSDFILTLAALAFYAAAQLYARIKLSVRILAIAVVSAVAWAFAASFGFPLPLALGAGAVFFLVARTFWEEGRKQESKPDQLLSFAFAALGLLCVAIPLGSSFQIVQAADLPPLILVPELFAGVLLVMAVYEEERRRVERNMLALSSLNLATSGFVGGEIQKMLAQALDRVLNVVRIPAGALFMRQTEAGEHNSVVATGLNESFCTTAAEHQLDDKLIDLVARLGGLVVLRDLTRDANWEALEKEPSFRQIRQLLVSHNLKTVVGISLQAKDRVFGALLLGTPDPRTFKPGELRLLLALGQQIGMAVENSYLIQQTARRSEELHILNEIGRALNSTMQLDTLLERIHIEMRGALDAESFFIAFYDQKLATVNFEIEVIDGVRQPKRSSPAGNYLIEHVVRTGQPVFINDSYQAKAQQAGFETVIDAGSLCAVPLVIYDHPVGALTVFSRKERMFDEGHLEFLRVLASEAGIAIENARLFSEEQKKSRQLTLLNNVSRHAITSLDPSEMLTQVVLEMEKHLPYDHIGVATVDYSNKELVVRAEAGSRREALGRRIPLGEGLIGQVARSGQMAAVREISASSLQAVLPDSRSAVALPVTCAEQFLGVMYVESQEPCTFPEQDLQLLRTLADLFAGALHNAMTFQKAQEQAITDGLTGVKTHRFLMEALSAEWKRSTRAGRQFSLVLMDLDRFKFVNDFYGHLEGDVVLQRVGQILEQNCRRSDVVARYGGDEFVILMPETPVDQARQLASKLRGWIASDPLLRDKNVTGSFGVAGFPMHGSTPQELIQVADSSMYLSKHQGGNAVSTSEQGEPGERKKWKKDVLEAYLGVKLKRLFATGPDAFDQIYRRLEQFTRSLSEDMGDSADRPLPTAAVEAVTSLALAIDAKDQYTQGHSQKVSTYAVMIAQALNMAQHEIEEIRLGGLLHDIGKVGIPEGILNKSGPLDTTEWETMKTHTELGAKILEPLKSMERIREMVRHHHEFYDGSGYPERLEGESIPYGARVIAVADAYDTITSERAYKKARTAEDALRELERCASHQFDPQIVAVFVDVMRRIPYSPVVEPPSADAGVLISGPADVEL